MLLTILKVKVLFGVTDVTVATYHAVLFSEL